MVKNPPANARDSRKSRDEGSYAWVRKTPWSRTWQPTPVFLPGKFHGQRILWAAVHGVAKSQKQLSTHTLSYAEEKTEVQREEVTRIYHPLIQHMLTAHLPCSE